MRYRSVHTKHTRIPYPVVVAEDSFQQDSLKSFKRIFCYLRGINFYKKINEKDSQLVSEAAENIPYSKRVSREKTSQHK